jgi:DNA-directed RNA polymerase I, II, and III subunit RPABC5
MIIPILCPTCNKIIANKYQYYKEELRRRKLAMNIPDGQDPLIININAVDIEKTIAGKLMDELGLIRICCRKVVLTSLDIIDEL